jgi:histidinol phosphatase-like enzyme
MLQIPELPIRVLAAMSMTDVYRKPNIGMYQVVEKLYRDKGYEIDLACSVFVGDAAGRLAVGGKRKDHSNTDYQFAVNVGLRFITPEVSCSALLCSCDRNTSSALPGLLSLNHPSAFVLHFSAGWQAVRDCFHSRSKCS